MDATIAIDESRAHYLLGVMRKSDGDKIAVFNGKDGEWMARLVVAGKRSVSLAVEEKISDPKPSPDVWLVFAAVKNKNEFVVEKATELGVTRIFPVIGQHSVVKSFNEEKLAVTALEAAEQCERTDVPEIIIQKNLGELLGGWPKERTLLYGDETGTGENISVILSGAEGSFLDPSTAVGMTKGMGLLIGPEGGFSANEHAMLKAAPFAKPFSMGPRILKADTAAIAALACVMMHVGDWDSRPHFVGVT